MLCARQRLIVVFTREDAVRHRNAGIELDFHHRAARVVRDDFEVIGVATNHRTQGDQRIEAPALRHGLQDERDFQRAGHRGDFDIAFGHAQTLELIGASGQQTFADILIEAAHDDADRQPLAGEDGFVLVDVLVTWHFSAF